MSAAASATTSDPSPAVSARVPESGLDPLVLLRSLRRRWLPSVLLGVPLAVAAGAAAYLLIPAPYVAVAEIYFKSFEDNLVFQTNETQAMIRVRKETHQRLVTSRDVLTAALRDIDVPRTELLAGAVDPVQTLAERVAVDSEGTEFFTISMAGERPQELATIVNAVAGAYMTEVVDKEIDVRRSRLAELQKFAAEVKEERRLQRESLRTLAERVDSSSSAQADQRHEHLLEMQVEVRKELAQVALELMRLQISDRIQSGDEKTEPILDSMLDGLVAQDPEFQAAEASIEQARRAVERTVKALTPGHPSVAEAKKRLTEAESRLASVKQDVRTRIVAELDEQRKAANDFTEQQTKEQIASLAATKKELEGELDKMRVNAKQVGLDSLELDEAVKELGRLEALFDTLTAEIGRRALELKNAEDRPVATIAQEATVPTARSLKKKLVGTLGAAGGSLALVMFAFAYLDSRLGRISSRKEVSEKLSMNLIGSIPALPRSVMVSPGSARQRKKAGFWTAALKESVDATRTLLLAHAERDQTRTILVTSAVPAEGKTTLSLHLATSLARAGRHVVLVDADLRRPSLARIYDADGVGLCEVIRGEVTLDEALTDGNVPGLAVLTAGEADQMLVERLADGCLAPVFAELRERFDFVIVDSPPVLPLCDALVIARHVDTVLFALRQDHSRRSTVAAAVDRFRAMDVPVLGAVAIGLHDDPAGYGGNYAYYGRYASGASPVGI